LPLELLLYTNTMKIKAFKLERYFAQYEFSSQYLLSSSDSQALTQEYVLSLADAECGRIWHDLSLGYTESRGHPLLRYEIAGLYTDITPDEVLVAAPEEGVFLALNSILEKGDRVICTFPGYQSLYEIANSIGCRVTRWLPEEENGWRFNPEFLEKAAGADTKLLIINFPHNPTGYSPDREDFDRILKIAKSRNMYVFSDEMYRLLEYNPADRLPAACDSYAKAVSLSGMSKAFGLAGTRIGWLATRERRLFNKMAALKDYTTICSSAPSEILALITLRAKADVLAEQLNRIKRNLSLLETFFVRNQELCEWIRPKAGTIAFPKLKSSSGATAFCRRTVSQAGIMLLPSTVYNYGDSHFRVGFGRENLPVVLERFEEFIKNYNNPKTGAK
jgi:aspartate/methionine/tyrosine aminotransferase